MVLHSVLALLLAPAFGASSGIDPVAFFPSRAEGLAAVGPAGPEAVGRELLRFKTEGWAVLPVGAVIGSSAHAEIARHIASEVGPEFSGHAILDWPRPGRGPEAFERVMEDLRLMVGGTLGAERAGDLGAYFDAVRGRAYDTADPHADYGIHWKAIYALDHSGTRLFMMRGGRLREIVAPPRAVVLISGSDRERDAGVPATVHASPAGVVTSRDMLQVASVEESVPSVFLSAHPRIQARVARVKRWLERRL
jgi:hypothetical protein